jgi:hypothetical protein
VSLFCAFLYASSIVLISHGIIQVIRYDWNGDADSRRTLALVEVHPRSLIRFIIFHPATSVFCRLRITKRDKQGSANIRRKISSALHVHLFSTLRPLQMLGAKFTPSSFIIAYGRNDVANPRKNLPARN